MIFQLHTSLRTYFLYCSDFQANKNIFFFVDFFFLNDILMMLYNYWQHLTCTLSEVNQPFCAEREIWPALLLMFCLLSLPSHHCSGSLEPESSCHDRDWIMELPMEADILTFTGIFTPEDASVASCFPFDITISLSWFPLLSITPLHSAIP